MEDILKLILLSIIVIALISSFSSLNLREESTSPPIIVPEEEKTIEENITFHGVRMGVPAVDEEGNGVTTTILVESKPGEGRVLVDINQLLFWVDTQNSIRIAQKVAQNYTMIDLEKIDLIYGIETNASLIGGPSAGAALTVATISLLENKTINSNVMITGTINHDGSIGTVGEIVAKAKAAKDIGITTFLVPFGQAVQTYYTPLRHCEKFGWVEYCTTEYKSEKVDVSKDVGIEVKEVSNIEEALKYFLM